MNFLTACFWESIRLLCEAENVLHTTVTFSEQLWFHLVCLAMYTLFMKSHSLSFFCLKQIAWFSYLSTWWSIVQWDYGSLKTKSLHCSVQNPSVHLLGAVITQPTAASELLKSPTKPGQNLKERFMHPPFGMRTYARLCDQSIASII